MEKKQVKVIALIDEEQRRALYHRLLDENMSFAEWLRRAIDVYLNPPKPRRGDAPKPKEGSDGNK